MTLLFPLLDIVPLSLAFVFDPTNVNLFSQHFFLIERFVEDLAFSEPFSSFLVPNVVYLLIAERSVDLTTKVRICFGH